MAEVVITIGIAIFITIWAKRELDKRYENLVAIEKQMMEDMMALLGSQVANYKEDLQEMEETPNWILMMENQTAFI